MNICTIGAEIAPVKKDISVGGVTNSVLRLCSGLNEKKVKNTIITTVPRSSNIHDFIISYNWGDIHQIPIKSRYMSIYYGLDFMFKSIKKSRELNSYNNFKILHGHSGYAPVSKITYLSAKLLGIPSIHTLYCPISSKYNNNLSQKISSSTIGYLALRNIDRVIAISNNIKNSLIEIGLNPTDVEVIPPPIPTKYPKEKKDKLNNIRNQLNISDSDFILLFVGNMSKTKGIDVLIDSMKKIVDKYPNIKLIITLELPHKEFEERKAELKLKIIEYKLNNNIIFLGIIPNMTSIIKISDIIIAPFLDINGISDYPLILLEAMSLNKTVISTKVGGIPEIVKHMKTGLLTSPGVSEDLYNAVVLLYENSNIKKEIEVNSNRYVKKYFSIDRVRDKTLEIYEEVLNK